MILLGFDFGKYNLTHVASSLGTVSMIDARCKEKPGKIIQWRRWTDGGETEKFVDGMEALQVVTHRFERGRNPFTSKNTCSARDVRGVETKEMLGRVCISAFSAGRDGFSGDSKLNVGSERRH